MNIKNKITVMKDKLSTCVITTKYVVNLHSTVVRVIHDDEGYWQFLGEETLKDEDAMLISLEEMLQIDESLITIMDMPRNKMALRKGIGSPWSVYRYYGYMRLSHIALGAERSVSGYDDALVVNFNYYTRFICNYLSKAVRKISVELEEHTMINVLLSQKDDGIVRSLSDNIRSVTLYCPEEELKRIVTLPDESERYERYLSFLEEGYRRSGVLTEEQISMLLGLHEQFRSGGYRNEWLFKKKPLREYGIYVYFNCYFTTYDFRLELEVYDLKRTRLLTKGTVMRTGPHEVFFYKRFRKLTVENGYLTLLDFLGHPFVTFDLVRLSAGDFHVYYCEPENTNGNGKHATT